MNKFFVIIPTRYSLFYPEFQIHIMMCTDNGDNYDINRSTVCIAEAPEEMYPAIGVNGDYIFTEEIQDWVTNTLHEHKLGHFFDNKVSYHDDYVRYDLTSI